MVVASFTSYFKQECSSSHEVIWNLLVSICLILFSGNCYSTLSCSTHYISFGSRLSFCSSHYLRFYCLFFFSIMLFNMKTKNKILLLKFLYYRLFKIHNFDFLISIVSKLKSWFIYFRLVLGLTTASHCLWSRCIWSFFSVKYTFSFRGSCCQKHEFTFEKWGWRKSWIRKLSVNYMVF